jgi:hypothetical protein
MPLKIDKGQLIIGNVSILHFQFSIILTEFLDALEN